MTPTRRTRARRLPRRVLVALLALGVLVPVGCGGPPRTEPPPASVEALDGAPPRLPTTDDRLLKATPPRLVARLDLQTGGDDLYVGEFPEEPRSAVTACYFPFPADEDTDEIESGTVTFLCDDLGDPLALFQWDGYAGRVDATVGTVDTSVDQVRLTFEEGCGVVTYEANGPALRGYPSRRLFMVDQSNGCSWETAEAVSNGVVVDSDVAPAPPRD